jgi:hypothetical protein
VLGRGRDALADGEQADGKQEAPLCFKSRLLGGFQVEHGWSGIERRGKGTGREVQVVDLVSIPAGISRAVSRADHVLVTCVYHRLALY